MSNIIIDSKPSSILQEILNWSSNCPDWQRDALRRIISGKITQKDIEDLEKLCRAKRNALEKDETLPIIELLEERHVPDKYCNATSISLVSLGQLQNVNRLPSNQTLSFSSAPGLTIIYGGNGAGKSGYARVIKKACRARGHTEQIEPNAYSESPPGQASAVFTIYDSSTNSHSPIYWQDGVVTDPRLGQIFLFDTACAEHYVHQDDSTTFIPFGLDILEKLSNDVCIPVRDLLQARLTELKRRIEDTKKLLKFKPHTVVGKLLSNLSNKTKEADINALANWTDEDNKRLHELSSILSSNPKQKSEQTRAIAQRIREFRISIAKIRRALSKSSVKNLRITIEDSKRASEAAKKIAMGKFDESFLPGTGNDLWKNLWKAAREYSTKSSYPGKIFPPTEDNARCVLCQSILDKETKARLKAFDEFMSATASQFARQKENDAKNLSEKFVNLFKLSNKKRAVEADLGGIGDQSQVLIENFVTAADCRLDKIIKILRNIDEDWDNIPPLTIPPSKMLRSFEKKLFKLAENELIAANPEERKKLESEHDELKDRQWLSGAKIEILRQIECYAMKEYLENCIKSSDTTMITRKNKELYNQLVTDAFCKRFEEEINKLGLRTLKVKLHVADGRRGVAKFGVRLEDAASIGVAKIASEGEKRCVALALFLAELSQVQHKSTLVFDDPVSSLDHLHKEKTAMRLVEESLIRQVIVFTHDPVFLNELQTSAETKNIAPHNLYIEWNGEIPGHCTVGLPWDWASVKERFDILEKKQRALKAIWSPSPNENNKRTLREIYSLLRATLERMIESTVFSNVVYRFRRDVKIKNLDRAVGFLQSECNELKRLYKRCCDITEAHDPAQGRHNSFPDPDELAKDIQDAKDLSQIILERQNKQVKKETSNDAILAS